MATAFLYNGYGAYDKRGDERGINLKWAGLDFFLPFQQTTAIPDRTLREVDHDKTTVAAGDVGHLTYMLVMVKGNYIADQLTKGQIPVENTAMGIQIVQGRATGKTIEVQAGITLEGEVVTVEVTEKEATKTERETAEDAAKQYKEMVVGEYFQSKRERMNGGTGRKYPDARVRAYMNELGVIDNDDVTAHQKPVGGIDADLIRIIMEEARKSTEVNTQTLREAIATVRKSGNEAQPAKAKPRSLGLAEFKAAKEAEEAALVAKE